MQDHIKESVKKAIDSIDDIDDVFEEMIENFPDNSKDLHKRSRKALKKVQDRFQNFLKDADTLADEAQLQANLGLMEARDRLEASRPVIEDFIDKAGDQSNQLLDEAQLTTTKGRLMGLIHSPKSWAETSGPRMLNFAILLENVPWPMNTIQSGRAPSEGIDSIAVFSCSRSFCFSEDDWPMTLI